jgi:hypothetical protein
MVDVPSAYLSTREESSPEAASNLPLRLAEVGAASHAEGAKCDAKLSADGQLMFFVRKCDLWAVELASNVEAQLTFSAGMPADDRHTSGVAEFIMQEEFDRYTGYWPSQRVSVTASGNTVYRLVYLQVDHSAVRTSSSSIS